MRKGNDPQAGTPERNMKKEHELPLILRRCGTLWDNLGNKGGGCHFGMRGWVSQARSVQAGKRAGRDLGGAGSPLASAPPRGPAQGGAWAFR